MADVVIATPGMSISSASSKALLRPAVSKLVWFSTLSALLALASLLPIVVSAFMMAAFFSLTWLNRRGPISAWIRLGAFSGMVIFTFTQGGLGMQSEAGTALLLASMIVKQVDTRTIRDASTMLLFNLIAPFTAMLQDQTPAVMGLSLMALFIGVSASLAMSETTRSVSSVWKAMARTAVLLAIISPLAISLYLLLPRLDSPMWVGRRSNSTTGVSDKMDISDWTRVSNDYSTAFRVHFKGTPPPVSRLYYRGYVLWTFNGKSWTSAPQYPSAAGTAPPLGDASKPWTSYTIYFEDKTLQRIFLLDYPTSRPPGSSLSMAGEATPISGRFPSKIDIVAAEPLPFQLTEDARKSALQIPAGSSPRLRQLALKIRETSSSDRDFIKSAMGLYSNGYSYTLSPPAVDRSQPIDSFMFDTKQGFCIHYSSSLTLLLRAAGIPARVVSGYASAEVSELGDYYRVRQADAHAWVEAWVDGTWLRLDPTSQLPNSRETEDWSASWRNGGYEMSDWFKSYWDRWITYYDAGSREKTLNEASKKLENAASSASNPRTLLAIVFGIISVLSFFVVLWKSIVLPTPSIIRVRAFAWLDKVSPQILPGDRWKDRLERIVLPSGLSPAIFDMFQGLDNALFDPSSPKVSRRTRRSWIGIFVKMERAKVNNIKDSEE